MVNNITALINGKGGGKPESAQVSGTNISVLTQALDMSQKYAQEKLGCGHVTLTAPAASPSQPQPTEKVKEKSSRAERKQHQKPASDLLLHTYNNHIRAFPALIAAKYSNKSVNIANNFEAGVTNKSSDYIAKFGSTSFPGFECPEGCLTGSIAPALYLAPDNLKGVSPTDQAKVLSWMTSADVDILPLVAAGLVKKVNKNDGSHKAAMTQLQRLNTYLRDHTFLVGERISLADIAVFSILIPAFQKSLDSNARKELPCLTRWFNTILNQPNILHVVGKIELN